VTARALAHLIGARAHPGEMRAAVLAFLCNFVLLGSYYILRPVRDTMATVFGADELQNLFTGTFVMTLVCAPLFAWAAARFKLTWLLPGIFWFLLANIMIFYVLFRTAPQDRWVAAAYYWWFSTVNLFLISIFWTLMADIFSAAQATRLFAFIAAGGSTGAITGPLITTGLVRAIGVAGLLLVAAVGFLAVILMVHLLIAEKARLRVLSPEAQKTTLDHSLPGNPLRGFALLLRSPFMLNQAAFMLLMTWIATIFYFLQTDIVTRTFSALESRTIAFASVDLVVNIAAAAILILGLGRLMQRFGVTSGLVLTPLLMALCFVALALAPGFVLIQAGRALQRITQYGVARPAREVLFTVVDQQSKYKAKNVIDTAVYRFGDLSSAWAVTGLRAAGFGMMGAVGFGLATAAAWGAVALALGRRYETLRRGPAPVAAPAE
jgi:AAA family ATP:ADP antiporter